MGAVIDATTGRVLAWSDAIPLRYEYTSGVAGETFLRGLKEARIIASKCSTCGETRVPPRIYCLECYGRARVDVELLHSGRVASLSTARLSDDGSRLTNGGEMTFGFVTFEGVSGGLVHRLLGSPSSRNAPEVGDSARPVFVPPERRSGSILDLEGFRVRARGAGTSTSRRSNG